MTKRALLVAVLMLLALSAVAAQQDADRILLRYRWVTGDEIVWNVESESSGEMVMRDLTKDPAAEQRMDLWMSTSMQIRLVVETVDEDGTATISLHTGKIEVDRTVSGQQQYIVVDPEAGTVTVNGEATAAPTGLISSLKGPFRMKMSARGEVLDMEMPAELEAMAALSGVNIAQWMRLNRQWQVAFPEEPIGVGHVWGGILEGPMGENAQANMTVVATYMLSGFDVVDGRECAVVEMMGAMDIPEPAADAATEAVEGAEGATPAIRTILGPGHFSVRGTVYFDAEAGAVVASTASNRIDLVRRTMGTAPGPEGQTRSIDAEIIMNDMKSESNITVE